MGERDIAALLRQIDGDALDEFGVRDSEEILDADFDGQVGLSDLLDTLGTYVRHRSSMYITQDDGSEPF